MQSAPSQSPIFTEIVQESVELIQEQPTEIVQLIEVTEIAPDLVEEIEMTYLTHESEGSISFVSDPISIEEKVESIETPPIEQVAPQVEKKASALSLSSIRTRREMESSLEKKVVNPDDLPKEPFTYEQLSEEWHKYAEKLARSGFMLMSSLMGMVPPIVKGTTVSLEMPNEGSKLSFDENKFDLVNYLRKKLSNYDLEIEIIVNEEIKIKKKVLDKEDKLVRFIELNPAMQYMKEIFDLEFKQ